MNSVGEQRWKILVVRPLYSLCVPLVRYEHRYACDWKIINKRKRRIENTADREHHIHVGNLGSRGSR